MKNVAIIFALVACFYLPSTAQDKDRIRFFTDVYVSAVPVKLAGVEDAANSSISGNGYLNSPRYEYRELTALAARIGAHVYFHLPVYKSAHWSTGFRFSVGAGAQMGVVNAEGLNGFVIDLPQYVFYRNTSTNLDITFLLGYKWSLFSLPYNVVEAAAEIKLSDQIGLRAYGSLNSYKYYGTDQNDNLLEVAKIREFGLGVLFYY